MQTPKIEFVTQDIEIAAGLSGVQTFPVNFDRRFTHVVGMAIFTEELPAAVKDFKISFGTAVNPEMLPTVTRRMLESNDQAPNDKLLTVSLPCDETIKNIVKVTPSVEIPESTSLKFQIVYKVINAREGNALNLNY